jgi:hypothetical protein
MISSVGWDPDTQQMQVTFSNGSTYAYDDVAPADAEGLMSAGSPGTFFHQFIKDAYAGVQVG